MTRCISVVVLAAVGMSLAACSERESVADSRSRAPIAVTVVALAAVETPERLEAGGVLTAQQSAAISSRIVAAIGSVRVTAGDRVRRGDVLVTLDARDVSERTAQARADAVAAEKGLAQARSEQRAAEAEHRVAMAWQQRIAALHARSSSTDQERDEAEARVSAAAARLAGMRAGVEGAEAHLVSAHAGLGVAAATESFAILRAPFDGLVIERLVDPGNLAAPGVPLLRIDSGGPRQVVVRVDEARVSLVRTGDRVRVLIGAADVADGEGIQGVVAEIARAIDADQRTFTVKIAVPGSVTARSGSFARVVFAGARRRALFVPAAAVQRHGQVASVYVVQDGVARVRLVQVGAATPAGVEVLAGLEAGESIVTSPLAQVTDGARVTSGAAPARRGGTS